MARLTELCLSSAPTSGNQPTFYRRKAHHLAGRPSNNRHTPANFAARFWAKVNRRGPAECWPWTGNCLPNGRGQVHVRWDGGKNVRRMAPALAWELTHGTPVPAGLVVCHRCDHPPCVNPSHLFVGTQAENIHDSIRKGRYNAFGRQKLNAEQVREIRVCLSRGQKQKDIAARFGVARNTISGIKAGASWTHLDAPTSNVERVPCVQVPVRGVLHVGSLSETAEPGYAIHLSAVRA